MDGMHLAKSMLPLAVLWCAGKLDLEDENVIMNLRKFAAAALTTSAFIALFVKGRIAAAADAREIRANKPSTEPFSTKPPEKENITVEAYDRRHADQLLGKVVTGSGILLLFHLQFGYVRPLMIMPLMTLIDALTGPVTRAHLYAMHVKRPWDTDPAPGSLSASMKMLKDAQMEAKGITPKESAKNRRARNKRKVT